ncbi:MAG: phosphate/phosphite/phosphonate ABC transporter substrate-binding protein, partial [Deltaproteobacteria bacterium]|nr:phosphate/phosphite/phosphonate ABC transporter substrate-binding protein [Deltaproteobacteria bacterium]
MKKISLRLLFVLFLSLSYGACNYISGNIGTKTNPLIIEILTPSAISEAVKHIDTIARFIEKDSGLKTAIYAPSKSIEYIQALSSSKRKADVAILNDIGYLFANDEFGARAELITTRGGSGVEALTSYCPAIVSVKLVSLEALNNHSIAFSDEYSTAGYLIPSFTLRENGIKVSKRVFAGSYQEALRMLISGKVDAAAIYT